MGIGRAMQKEMLGCFKAVCTTKAERINCIIKIMSKFMFTQMTKAYNLIQNAYHETFYKDLKDFEHLYIRNK